MLVDTYNRTLDYLRVSVTDRCNLRCVYCMPPGGVEWKPHDTMLSFEEILRVCRIMAGLGIRKIKLTGGEPLVRRALVSFVKSVKAIGGIEKVTITTNGLLMAAYLDEAETPASLPDGVNISLNALDPQRYKRITRQEGPGTEVILPLIDRLFKKQIPVKINCVPVRGYNEEEIIPLAALAQDKNIAVRFIELMPLGCAVDLEVIPGEEIAAILEKAWGALTPVDGVFGSGPAVYYSLPGFTGKIGFINPMTHGFCQNCNRLRLTSEGILKPCLSFENGLDLRQLLRRGATDDELAQAITAAAAQKPQFHTFSDIYGAPKAERRRDGMSKIGG